MGGQPDAPPIAVHTAGRLHGELGVGVVRMRGEALSGSQLTGGSQVRPWLGPAVNLAVGLDLTPRMALRAGLELGVCRHRRHRARSGRAGRRDRRRVDLTCLGIGAVLEL